jgi:hypothetical protein
MTKPGGDGVRNCSGPGTVWAIADESGADLGVFRVSDRSTCAEVSR